MLDWLAERGAMVDRLSLALEGETGRGVRARDDIKAGERVLAIPRAMMITTALASQSPAGRVLARAPREAANAHAILAAFLLQERDDPRSSWRPYLDALPSSCASAPLFYGDDDLALLRGSYLPGRIAARRAALRSDFDELRAAGGLAGASFDAFVWARFLVSSRAFGFAVAGRKTLALIPMADMLNHRIPPEVRWGYDDEANAFVMIAARDIRAGEPVHDSYGPKCNGRFLLSYGFVLDDNPDNEAAVRLSVPQGAPGLETKLRLLRDASRPFLVSSRIGSDATQAALAFLRVAHASDAELHAAVTLCTPDVPIGPRNEALALGALADACAEALDRFPTSLDDDDALLQDGSLAPNARNCIVMRRGEKQALHRLRAAAQAAAAESPPSAARLRTLGDMPPEGGRDAEEAIMTPDGRGLSLERESLSDAEIGATIAEASAQGAEALAALGVMLRALGRTEDAAACYTEAMARAPGEAGLRAGLAAVLTDLGAQAGLVGERAESIRLYEKALSLHPASAEALYNLGVAWMEERCLERAAFLFEMAFQVDPGRAEAMNNLGIIHNEISGPERAAECYLAALRARPRFPEALNNLAVVYTSLGRPGDAASLLEAALRHAPGYPEAHNNLGVVQLDLGAVPDAIESFERCLALAPLDRSAGDNRLLAWNYVCPGDDPAASDAHRQWGERFSAIYPPLPPLAQDEAARRAADGSRPLVVGYLSPDLFAHSVSYFIEAPLRHHDPARALVIVYSCVSRPDDTTQRLRSAVEARRHAWRDVGHLPEDLLARLIRDDAVDILVELTGHMSDNRLGAVARRPAPVQATWIGYPSSTGLAAVDSFITDAQCDPPGTRQAFVEEPARLPGCFLCFTPPPDVPDVAPLPAGAGGGVTFGSFGNLAKITPEVLDVWARLLTAVPGSRIAFKRRPLGSDDARHRLLAAFAERGVDPERVILKPSTPTRRDHLAEYAQIDVSLDPWPYTGVATTCESLLMGVPVITLRGGGHAHNTAHSLLSAVGLDEAWSAGDRDAYVAIAERAAADLPALAALRAGLRRRLLASPLCDGPGFVRGLEDLYGDLWARWRERTPAPAR